MASALWQSHKSLIAFLEFVDKCSAGLMTDRVKLGQALLMAEILRLLL